MTILLINSPEIKEYLDNLWVEDLWVIDTTLEDAQDNFDIYEPDYIICSNREDAEVTGGFWHEDLEIIKEICNGIT